METITLQNNAREILTAYGYNEKDRYISRMFIRPNESNKNKQSSTYHFFYEELIEELSSCKSNDLYISMNDFKKASRREDNLNHLKHLYVDLDTYHSIYADSPYCNEYILELLEESFFGKKFPEPNLVVSSGRGMYLIWNINEHKNALPRWKTVQKYLCQICKEFGADPKVSSDSARVLRIPGSINSKSGKTVTILKQNQEEHSLYEFLEYYMPASYMEGIRLHEKIRKEQNNAKENENVKTEVNAKKEYAISSIHNNKTLLEARLSDLETLLTKYRDMEHGSKEYIFFLYRMWAMYLYKNEKLVNEKMKSLNASLQYGADFNRLLKETNSALQYYTEKKIRCMKNETIIEFLSITASEMKDLKTIISKEEAAIRKAKRNRDAYLAKLELLNKAIKKESIETRYFKIASYLDAGYTKVEISELLGISYRQVLRDIKAMNELGMDTFKNYSSDLNDCSTSNNDDTMDNNLNVTNIKPYLLQDEVLSPLSFTPDSTSIQLIEDVSMNRLLTYTITPSDLPATIQSYLQMKKYSSQNIIDLKKDSESVYLNGEPALLKTPLKENDLLAIHLVEQVKETTIVPVELPFPIVYEDEDIIVINKPAKMSIHPSINHYMDTLANAACYYFTQKGEDFVYRCINRLDKDTSGLTILAKHSISASILYQSMMNREIHREYLAVVEGEDLPDEGVIDAPIARKKDSIIEREVSFELGERAVTHYKVLKRENGMSLLSLWLETGRTHQIRVHMNYLGYPLVGDDLYHPVKEQKMDRQALHSYHLTFTHPITGVIMRLEAPIPEDIVDLIGKTDDHFHF